MSGTPILDPRQRSDIMAELAAHAREYTPEWRYEGAQDDPGSALAELFGDMFYQTVDRMNSVPEKLYTEFLNLTGFIMPDPMPASGPMQFTAHDTVEAPVPVPEGTAVFTEDEEGEHIVYATGRRIESTPAQLRELYFVAPRSETIERLDTTRPNPFFAPAGGEELQRHRFSLSQNEVLALRSPFEIEVELRQEAGFASTETAQRLANSALGSWTFRSGETDVPFTSIRAESGRVILTYEGEAAFSPDGDGDRCITYTCAAGQGSGKLILDSVRLRSRPLGRVPVDSAANGDVPLDLEAGDYCFSRRPAVYSLCYLRSDQVFSKRGAQVDLRLDVGAVITDPPSTAPQYEFTQRIIDKRDAVVIVPDDVYVSQVTWEYYNGAGWRPLKVEGDKNPFSCQREGAQELRFDVPADLAPVEVNAEEGFYIRSRVVHVENEFSMTPRWVVPFLKSADCLWSYPDGIPVDRLEAENNGEHRVLEDARGVDRLGFPGLVPLEDHPAAMYFCFDRSPNAMPLSIYFDVAGRVKLEDKLSFEAWTGSRFEPVRSVDLTRNLLHPGTMLLYLPKALPERELFGTSGCWLRLVRSSYLPGSSPRVNAVGLNIVQAAAREQAEEEVFSAGAYEADLCLRLFHSSVLEAQVWVDEVNQLAVGDAQRLEQDLPGRVRMEWDDRVLRHCWVLWERTASLPLCGGEDRCYELDPYEGTITFGNGIHGRVLPEGLDNIRVRYAFGGGTRGNRAAGTVTQVIGALPRISQVENLTAMSGGTDRLPPERVDAIANKRLRNRDRAAGARDFEEIVILHFPQARHVKCFPGRDAAGAYVPGHVSVVVEGSDLDSSRATDDLCQRIYEDLSARCDCVMTAEGRLHVVGSTVITVSSTVLVEMEDLDRSVETQREIARRLEELINVRWRERDIGSQIRGSQVWQTVRDTPNVRLVRNILLEGRYDQSGIERVVPLEEDDAFPYATVKSGIHLIQVT